MVWFKEEWRQRDRWTSSGDRGYVPGKVGLLCPREGKGICCIANWWSLVNCRVGRKLELNNQSGLFQRSWRLQNSRSEVHKHHRSCQSEQIPCTSTHQNIQAHPWAATHDRLRPVSLQRMLLLRVSVSRQIGVTEVSSLKSGTQKEPCGGSESVGRRRSGRVSVTRRSILTSWCAKAYCPGRAKAWKEETRRGYNKHVVTCRSINSIVASADSKRRAEEINFFLLFHGVNVYRSDGISSKCHPLLFVSLDWKANNSQRSWRSAQARRKAGQQLQRTWNVTSDMCQASACWAGSQQHPRICLTTNSSYQERIKTHLLWPAVHLFLLSSVWNEKLWPLVFATLIFF